MADIVLCEVRADAEERIRDPNISLFTRQLQEVGYIRSCKVSRKPNISLFTKKVQEIWLLDF